MLNTPQPLQSLSFLSAGFAVAVSNRPLRGDLRDARAGRDRAHPQGLTTLQSLYLGCLFSEAPAADLPLLQLFHPPPAAMPAHRQFPCAVPNRDKLETEQPVSAAVE